MTQNQTSPGPQSTAAPQRNGHPQGYYRRMTQCVQDNPMSAAMAVMGFGFGLGLVVGALSGGPRYSHQAPAAVAQRLGREMIEAMVSVLPESLTSQIEM